MIERYFNSDKVDGKEKVSRAVVLQRAYSFLGLMQNFIPEVVLPDTFGEFLKDLPLIRKQYSRSKQGERKDWCGFLNWLEGMPPMTMWEVDFPQAQAYLYWGIKEGTFDHEEFIRRKNTLIDPYTSYCWKMDFFRFYHYWSLYAGYNEDRDHELYHMQARVGVAREMGLIDPVCEIIVKWGVVQKNNSKSRTGYKPFINIVNYLEMTKGGEEILSLEYDRRVDEKERELSASDRIARKVIRKKSPVFYLTGEMVA